MERNPYRVRIKALVEALNEVINSGKEISRGDVVEILRGTYDKHGLKPIKGKSNPPDLYDKELSALYVVGKYGLGLDIDYPQLFSRVFYIEEVFERCVELIMSKKYSEARELLKSVSQSNVIDSNTIARMLRVPFVKLILGFTSEEEFSTLLKLSLEAFPEDARTVENYAKFYVAFRMADLIYRGAVRNKSFKEAYKKALAIRLGFPRAAPSDSYISIIAREVFNVPDRVLNNVLDAGIKRERED